MIEKRIAKNQTFIHYSYKWNEESILRNGLFQSMTGQMVVDNKDGAGLYCCLASDEEAQLQTLQFMEDEVDWDCVAELVNEDYDPDDEDTWEIDGFVEREEFITAFAFKYSGEYYLCTENEGPFVKTGYVLIPAPLNDGLVIPSHQLELLNELLPEIDEDEEDEVDIFSGTYIDPHYCYVCDENTLPDPDDWRGTCIFCGTPLEFL